MCQIGYLKIMIVYVRSLCDPSFVSAVSSQNSQRVRIKFDRYLTVATGFFTFKLPIPLWMLFLILRLAPGLLATWREQQYVRFWVNSHLLAPVLQANSSCQHHMSNLAKLSHSWT